MLAHVAGSLTLLMTCSPSRFAKLRTKFPFGANNYRQGKGLDGSKEEQECGRIDWKGTLACCAASRTELSHPPE